MSEGTNPPENVAEKPPYDVLEASLHEAHEALTQAQATITELHSALKAALVAGGTLARVR